MAQNARWSARRIDVILAPATRPEPIPPPTEAVDAWIAQNGGNESYFFNNVKHEIPAPDDTRIWMRIKDTYATWPKKAEYEATGRVLQS